MLFLIRNLFVVLLFLSHFVLEAQTLIINEVSNGPSGLKEYIELVVVDNTVIYDCNNTTPPCIDIRGWILDDNNGYHGTNGVAAGAVRFNNNALWSCVPVGTIILVYNGQDFNPSIPPDDVSLTDGNCSIIVDLGNLTYFEFTQTTPGDVACSYPTTGWGTDPTPNWSNIAMSNTGDCARIVDINGCEVFSVCYGSCNQNTLIYFGGAGTHKVWSFGGGDPFNQANWTSGCAGNLVSCGSDDQTPGFANNAANESYIAQFNNNCTPITPLIINASVNLPTSCDCNNSATASASGSIPGYTYEWFDDAFISIGQNTATATNLCAGTYNVIISSSINCIDTSQIVINNLGAVNAGAGNSISVCSSASSFNLFSLLSNAPDNGGFWEGPSAISNGDLGTFNPNVNTSGDYDYIVLGSGGCPNDTAIVSVTLTNAPNAGLGNSISFCSSDASSDLFDLITNNPVNTGFWNGPSSLSNGNIGTFNPASNLAGTYFYIVNGSGTCANDTAFVIVNVATVPNAGIDGVVLLCENQTAIDLIDYLGGNPQQNGTWSPNTSSANGIFDPSMDNDGIYTYTVSGIAPCPSATSEVEVTIIPNPIVQENITPISCFDADDGEIILDISPSVGNVVNWTFPNSTVISQQDIFNLSPGNYEYEVISANGCITTNSIVMNEPAELDIQLMVTFQTCPLVCDGSIIATSNNGIGNVQYSIDGVTFGNGTFNGLCSGNYLITVIDDNGCQNTINTVVTDLGTSNEPNINPFSNVCEEGGTINLTADIAGGTWTGFGIVDNANGIFDPAQTGIGIFNIIYTIQGQCGGDDTLAVSVVGNPVGTIEFSDTLGCLPFLVSFSNPASNASNVSCEWNMGDGNTINSCNTFDYTFTNSGCFDVSLTLENADGCSTTIMADQQICVLAIPDASFEYNSLTFNESETIFQANALDSNLTNYTWIENGIDVGQTTSFEFDFQSYPNVNETEICLSVINDAGCANISCETIIYKENFTLYIPNTFSPNSDGVNDEFYPVIYKTLPESFELLIFNRWGQLVFETNEINASWDGTFKSEHAEIDTYVYKITYKLYNDPNTYTQKGHVNLIR